MGKITLYPSNWLYNAGIVGFLRILEFGNRGNIFQFKEDGSVEIEESALNGFEILYFEYVSKIYLIQRFTMRELADFIREKLRSINGGNIKNNVKKIEAKFKGIEDKIQKDILAIKANKDWNTFKRGIEDIKNDFKQKIQRTMKDLQNLMSTAKDKEKINKIVDNIYKNFDDICSSVYNFKAQPDFLGSFYFNKNVVANPKGNRPERPKNFKGKYLDPIVSRKNGGNLCILCGKSYSEESISEFSEGDFSILGISSSGFGNFYNYYVKSGTSYNRKCCVCQLILLCTFAGFNLKPYQLREIDETEYIFVNYPSFEEAFLVNNNLQAMLNDFRFGIFTKKINTYFRSFELIIQLAKKKTRWVLENTYFAEIKTSMRKDQTKPKFVYFNIDKALAEVFDEFKLDTLLNNLSYRYEIYKDNPVYLSTEILKRLIQKKPLIYISFKILSERLSEKNNDMLPVWSLILLEFLINQKRRLNMSAGTSYGILKGIQEIGRKSFSLNEIDQEKRFHISLRFLTLIRGSRKEDFYHELLRLFVVYQKPVPESLFSLLTESEKISFQEKALAFLTGFISPSEKGALENKDTKEVSNE
ncbi:MAG: hypothetical protein NC905_01180 [Candidatus Omnitrophica bacterium]|nr:hypothetical protein [Candidatus Omnitrophota bacterium]